LPPVAGIGAAHHEHAAVCEQRRGVLVARDRERTGRRERAGLRIVELGRREDVVARALAADDEHAAVAEQRRGVAEPAARELAGGMEPAVARVEQLGAARRRAKAAPDDQHATVGEQRCGRGLARLGEVGDAGEPALLRIVQLGAAHRTAVAAAGDEDAAVPQRHGHMTGARLDERRAGLRHAARVDDLGRGRVELAVAVGALAKATGHQDRSVGEAARRMARPWLRQPRGRRWCGGGARRTEKQDDSGLARHRRRTSGRSMR